MQVRGKRNTDTFLLNRVRKAPLSVPVVESVVLVEV